jgi:hypothetical protein
MDLDPRDELIAAPVCWGTRQRNSGINSEREAHARWVACGTRAATLFADEPNMNQTALVAPHLVAFLPWLRLREPQTIGGYDFMPYRDREVRPNFAGVSRELDLIFSSYVDRNGNRFPHR